MEMSIALWPTAVVALVQATVTPFWIVLLNSPPAWIVAFSVFAKFVLAPAFNKWIRHEFRAEFALLAQFPLVVQRIETLEKAVEHIADMPEEIAHIRGSVDAIANMMAPPTHPHR